MSIAPPQLWLTARAVRSHIERGLRPAWAILLLGVACTGTRPPEDGRSAPHYPAYPKPAASTSEPGPVAAPPAAAPKNSSSTAGSPLRKTYEGSRALRTLTGKATYYGDSLAGNKTANGDRYDPKKFSAAHRTLRFGTIVRVVRTDTGKSTYVVINDRGPFGSKDRIIDLSRAAATELEMIRAGVVSVRVEIVEEPGNS